MINNTEINNIFKANMLNNREIGLLLTIVLIIIICVIILKKDFLKRVRKIIEVFDKKIIIAIFSILIWESLVIIVLNKFTVWSVNNLKDSIWWFFTAGIFVIFKVSFINKNNICIYLKDIVKACFAINFFIEFIYNSYIFSLPIEIFIWIFLSFNMFIKFYIENNVNDKATEENLKWLYSKIKILLYGGIGIGIIFSVINSPEKLLNFNNFKSLIINMILSISVIVPTYLLAIYELYEKLFIKLVHNENKKIVRYIKLRTFFYAKFNINKLDFNKFNKIFWLQKKEDIKRAFNEIES